VLVRVELDKTITVGRGDNTRTMTKRQVVAAQLRKAVKGGDIEAIKLAMVIDEDPASEEPIDQATKHKLFWKRAKKRWEEEIRRALSRQMSMGGFRPRISLSAGMIH
jgi:hypothetical protein